MKKGIIISLIALAAVAGTGYVMHHFNVVAAIKAMHGR